VPVNSKLLVNLGIRSITRSSFDSRNKRAQPVSPPAPQMGMIVPVTSVPFATAGG